MCEETLFRSGYHPAAVHINPNLLKSAVPNDPELESLLNIHELRKQNAEQQKALQAAREQFEALEEKYRTLEGDFHAAVSSRRQVDPNAPRIPLSADCILAVRAARARACPCDKSMCPVFFKGERCDLPQDNIPQCLSAWRPPYAEDVPYTLNRESILERGDSERMVLDLGTYQNELMRLEFTQDLLGLLPARAAVRNDTYRSCAMVGSSDILLREYLGDEITDHDLVVRFNGATTKGYEKHVGRVTNLRFVTSNWLGFREFPQETVVHLDDHTGDPLWQCDVQTECTNSTTTIWKFVEELKLFRELRVTSLHPKVGRWLNTPYNSGREVNRASTGFKVMLLLLNVCQKVDMYGFAGTEFKRYYDAGKIQEQFAAAVSKWIQEHRAGEPVSYPYASNNFRRRRLSSAEQSSSSSTRRLAGVPQMVRRPATAEELAAEEAGEISMGGNEWQAVQSAMERESWDSSATSGAGGASFGRHLLGKARGRVKRARAPGTAAVPAAASDAGHNVAWERDCQQQLVDVGMLAVHGVHVEFPTEEAAADAQAALEANVVG